LLDRSSQQAILSPDKRRAVSRMSVMQGGHCAFYVARHSQIANRHFPQRIVEIDDECLCQGLPGRRAPVTLAGQATQHQDEM
jgi:hypothetical protein